MVDRDGVVLETLGNVLGDTGNTAEIRSVHFLEDIVDLLLHRQVFLEIFYEIIVAVRLNVVRILIALRVNELL